MMKTIASVTFVLMSFVMGIGLATAQEVKTLREAPMEEVSEAPDVFQVEQDNRHVRSFRLQPPMIPHRIEKYEIDLKVNQCLGCHDWRAAAQEQAPEISRTHYQDPRTGEELDEVSRSRWFCIQCHAPQQDARPLVENVFRASPAGNQ